jgi:hypothetical protein
MVRIIIAAIVAAGYGIIALSVPPTASADECPPGYYWSKSHATCVERPDNNPVGAVALCADGKYSHSESRTDTCSENGGIARPCPCAGAAAPTPTAVYSNDYLYAQYNSFLATHGIDTSQDATRATARNIVWPNQCANAGNVEPMAAVEDDPAGQVGDVPVDQAVRGPVRYRVPVIPPPVAAGAHTHTADLCAPEGPLLVRCGDPHPGAPGMFGITQVSVLVQSHAARHDLQE